VEKAKQAKSDENNRLEYVAATRAREALIFMDELAKNADFSAFDLEECSSIIPVAEGDEVDNSDIDYKEYVHSNSEIEFTDEQLSERYVVLNPSAFEKRISKKDKTDSSAVTNKVDDELNDEEEIISDTENEKVVKGAILGTAMHRCFELFVNECGKDWSSYEKNSDKLINSCVCQAVSESLDKIPLDEIEDYRAELLKMMNGFVNDDETISKIKNAKKVYTELPFSYYTDDKESEDLVKALNLNVKDKKIWINGIADLVIKNADDSITIIDYKSDYRGDYTKEEFEKILNEEYSGQLTLYRYAMKKIMKTELDMIGCKICNYR
jgi:ATP-dependent exoDNAse (exonuclease V) beta subunit